jgi:hypothetical protein
MTDTTPYTSGFYWIKPSGRDVWTIAQYSPSSRTWRFCGNAQAYTTDELIRDGDTIGPQVDRFGGWLDIGAAKERAAIVSYLREDAARTRGDLTKLHFNKSLTRAETDQWELVIQLKVGLAGVIERGEHLK